MSIPEYEMIEFETLPSDMYPNLFVFWPNNGEESPYENFMTEIYNWCLENFDRHGWYVTGNKVFVSDDHAVALKLRWM